MEYCFTPIASIHTPYPEKFSIPRQPGLVTADNSWLQLRDDCNREEILRGLEAFSHLWLIWVFHQARRQRWKPTVRPPRLGGNQKVGVFASRSPFRPNPIGMSVVKLEGITRENGQWRVRVSGVDLVDGTPILDIKPYLPYSDSPANANGAYAAEQPAYIPVIFTAEAQTRINNLCGPHSNTELLMRQVLGQQPQPAYHQDGARSYGTRLLDLNIRWRSTADGCLIETVTRITAAPEDNRRG